MTRKDFSETAAAIFGDKPINETELNDGYITIGGRRYSIEEVEKSLNTETRSRQVRLLAYPSQIERLDRLKERTGKSRNELLIEAINRYLDEEEGVNQ